MNSLVKLRAARSTGGLITTRVSDLVSLLLRIIAIVRAVLVPQPLEAVTLSVPEVAEAEKLIFTELVVPVIVAPLPE